MALKAARFMSLFLVALTLGMTFCHVMEIAGKLRLSGTEWLTVQHNLYVAFGTLGAGIEIAAILATGAVALLVRRRRPAFRLTAAAFVCTAAGLVVWAALVAPVNEALAGWTPETLPPDWTAWRNRWEIGHALHALLFALAFALLMAALLAETPDHPTTQ